MKKQSLWKPLSLLPALAMLAVIFSFSAQTGTQSGGLSQAVRRTGSIRAYTSSDPPIQKKMADKLTV